MNAAPSAAALSDRSFDQLLTDAHLLLAEIRNAMDDRGLPYRLEPAEFEFHVSEREYARLRDRPPFRIGDARNKRITLCGIPVRLKVEFRQSQP